VDLNEAIRSLYEEKKKLDKLIASLESVLADGARPAPNRAKPAEPKRRRRKFSAERRQEISERMRKYWAERRAKAAEAPSASGDGEAQPDSAELASPLP
jgi:ElaB/YqjD/DUF883 family membrane-anchored ribosome-binding protein